MHFVTPNMLSTSLTILGLCVEISGNKDAAYQYYGDALQCYNFVSASAKVRLSKFLEI